MAGWVVQAGPDGTRSLKTTNAEAEMVAPEEVEVMVEQPVI